MAGESLRVVSGNAGGKEISFEDEFEIGRAAEGDGTLGDDPEISRRHARITRRAGDQLTIEDLGSTNGTFVNGKRIESPTPLTPGDTMKMGTTTIQVLDASGKAPQATAFASTQPEPGRGRHEGRLHRSGSQPPAARPRHRRLRRRPRRPLRGPRRPPSPARRPRPAAAAPRRSRLRARSPRARAAGAADALFAVLGLLVVAGVVVGVLSLTGGDDGGDENKVLSTREIIDANRASTVRINTRGPARDDDGNRIVVERRRLGHRLQRQPRPRAHQRARRGRPELDQGHRRRQRGERRGARPRALRGPRRARAAAQALGPEAGRAGPGEGRARGRQGHRARLSRARSRRRRPSGAFRRTDGTVSSGVTSASDR